MRAQGTWTAYGFMLAIKLTGRCACNGAQYISPQNERTKIAGDGSRCRALFDDEISVSFNQNEFLIVIQIHPV